MSNKVKSNAGKHYYFREVERKVYTNLTDSAAGLIILTQWLERCTKTKQSTLISQKHVSLEKSYHFFYG